MNRSSLWASIAAWIAVWAFWMALTHHSHPTFSLALIVTTSLVAAYAIVAYANHLLLIPHILKSNGIVAYSLRLIPLMLFANGVALAIIRVSYFQLWGPDADPYGFYKHYAIDLFGMVVHLILASASVWIWGKFRPIKPTSTT